MTMDTTHEQSTKAALAAYEAAEFRLGWPGTTWQEA
jgi:hypothetical protein